MSETSALCPEHDHPQLVEPVSEAQFKAELEAVLRACGVLKSPNLSFPAELADRHRGDPRAYAEVQPEALVFRFAAQARALPTPNRLGLIVHEVGHVLDPEGTESGADSASERALVSRGLSLAYDGRWPGKGLQRLEGPAGDDLRRALGLR